MTAYINPRAKLLRHPDRLAAWREGTSFAPLGVEFDLTNRCNLGCEFCHFGYTHTRGPLSHRQRADFAEMGDEIDAALAVRILGEMAAAGIKSVTFTGGGEPTLHPQFRRIAGAAADRGLKLGLYTNGTLVDEVFADFIKRHFEWVVVSLDAADREAYRALKRADGFARAGAGVRRLVAADGAAVIGASFLLDAQNVGRAAEMVQLGRALGVTYSEFRPIVYFDLDAPDDPQGDPRWIGNAHPTLMQLHAPDVHIAWDKFERLRRWERGYTTCHAVLFTAVVTPNGKMWTCVNRRGFPDSCLGDLTRESFAEITGRQTPYAVNAGCRVLCRGDALNVMLDELQRPLPHEEFV